MKKALLVVNAGSSSIKFSVYETSDNDLQLISKGQVEGIGVKPNFVAKSINGDVLAKVEWPNTNEINHLFLIRFLLDWIQSHHSNLELIAAGHRVVHGGLTYSQPTLVNDSVFAVLQKLIPLAPLHQPHNLAAIQAMRTAFPRLPQIACFDTAFHRTNPSVFQHFFIPRALREEGVRRYGFHGLSYEYIASQLQEISPSTAQKKVIVAHLGSGASMCGLSKGLSVCTSMGMTAVDGLPMGTRPGSFDAGAVLYLLQEKKMSPSQLETLFYKQSGLLGLSGISNDLRNLEESQAPEAQETIETFAWRICQMAGSLASAIEGFDALVFTGGIGENSRAIRRLVCQHLSWLGLKIDEEKNQISAQELHLPQSQIKVFVIPTNEELMIARHTLKTLTKV